MTFLSFPRSLTVSPSLFAPRPAPVALPVVHLPRPRALARAALCARLGAAARHGHAYCRAPLSALSLPTPAASLG